MQLKQYQTDALAILRRFFEEARIGGAKSSYEAITREPEQAGRVGRYGGAYKALTGLPNVPYVCLRLPTGGGKTVLGAHAVAVARDAWVEKDWPMVLWLTPTKTIRRQTAEALKNPGHPYRHALDEAFDARVRVFDIADFAHIRPHDIRDKCCVVVGTIQSLRVKDTEGRKVYDHNENLEPNFSALKKTPADLETLDSGGVKFSFANLMHIHRPLMIVDEAQNAVTGLTREMQGRVNPCAIIEFTATPRINSNILHSVSAQELKAEEMIKLPIILSEHDSWQNAVNSALVARAKLAETAADDPDYLRPIVLFQAQPKKPGGYCQGAETTPDGSRAHPRKADSGRDRRPARTRRDRPVRPRLSGRTRHHRRGIEGRLGLFLRLCFLFRCAHSKCEGCRTASRSRATDALRQASKEQRSEPRLCVPFRTSIR